MRTVLAVIAAGLMLGACASTAQQGAAARIECPALPGADELLAMRGKRAFIFGEMHGTVEAPALFGDFVCAAARQGPVLVGLEIAEEEQPALDAYLASDGSAQARTALLARRHWQSPDGRASQAKLALVERLRALRSAGLQLGAFAFVRQVAPAATQTPYEQAMAQAWRDALARAPVARLAVLVGNVHARRTPFRDLQPAAMHMPQGEMVTLDLARGGGFAWNCMQNGCGANSLGASPISLPRGIHRPPANLPPAAGRFDRWYSAGHPFTASPPAVARASSPGA